MSRAGEVTDGATVELWEGTRGTVRADGVRWRIDWPWGAATFESWELDERLRRGSIRLV